MMKGPMKHKLAQTYQAKSSD